MADPHTPTDHLTAALATAVDRDGDELRRLLHEAVAERLRLDSERGKLERRILTLAARAEDTDAARELRRLWLRHRTLTAQLAELRRLISEARRRLER